MKNDAIECVVQVPTGVEDCWDLPARAAQNNVMSKAISPGSLQSSGPKPRIRVLRIIIQQQCIVRIFFALIKYL